MRARGQRRGGRREGRACTRQRQQRRRSELREPRRPRNAAGRNGGDGAADREQPAVYDTPHDLVRKGVVSEAEYNRISGSRHAVERFGFSCDRVAAINSVIDSSTPAEVGLCFLRVGCRRFSCLFRSCHANWAGASPSAAMACSTAALPSARWARWPMRRAGCWRRSRRRDSGGDSRARDRPQRADRAACGRTMHERKALLAVARRCVCGAARRLRDAGRVHRNCDVGAVADSRQALRAGEHVKRRFLRWAAALSGSHGARRGSLCRRIAGWCRWRAIPRRRWIWWNGRGASARKCQHTMRGWMKWSICAPGKERGSGATADLAGLFEDRV